jgi:hypothetical protein
VALAVSYSTVVSFTTTHALYTTATTGLPARDLVITNSGTATIFIAAGPAAASAVTTSSFGIPAGGSVVLTQCQVPASTIIYGVQGVATTTSYASIGFGSVVSVI